VGDVQASPDSFPTFLEHPRLHSSPSPMSQLTQEDPLESEIRRGREQLAACPTAHPQRGNACHDLGTSLWRSWKLTPSIALLDEVITLYREALALRPDGYPDHAASCNSLGSALLKSYDLAGATASLDDSIELHRKAISLYPVGHPDRATSCNDLASALYHRYHETGGSDTLDEIITLYRKALTLRPGRHPDRAKSCNNLATAIRDRAMSCSNLATALGSRYEATGSSNLLDEMITLHREALALRLAGHLRRAISCMNLANGLTHRYLATGGGSDLLDEIIKLQREALALRPAGHPHRSESCNNLANALYGHYEATGSSDLLDEMITLHREALVLRPSGAPRRALSCYELADSLWQHFTKTKDVTVVDEALALARESATSLSPSDSWQTFFLLFLVHTEQGSPHFSIPTATECLLQASTLPPSAITDFMREIQSRLNRMWLVHGTWTPDTTRLLSDVYSNLLDGLWRMTGFAFDTMSQLAALRSARSFGSDACMAALLSGRPRQAIELIDHAHGVIWTQARHQRDPQLQDLPRDLASELESLFRAVSMPMATHKGTPADYATGYLSPEDVRHQQYGRIQTLLTEVRAIPGQERFMLGRTYAQLRETAREHPVVVLVSARGYVYALIIRDSAQEQPDTLHLELTSDRLSLLRDTAASVGLRNEDTVQDVEMLFGRAMHISKRKEATALSTLAYLWHDVVKPVIDHLQLQVRIRVRFIVT
jgi:tetratricopeptide (TPR) repeat protein